jgi:hypothetical protein
MMPIRVYALIDSGADLSVIPKALAEFLDLDLSGKEETSFGIGGEIKDETPHPKGMRFLMLKVS